MFYHSSFVLVIVVIIIIISQVTLKLDHQVLWKEQLGVIKLS